MNILFLKATFEKMEIKANLTAIFYCSFMKIQFINQQFGRTMINPSNLFGLANCLSAT